MPSPSRTERARIASVLAALGPEAVRATTAVHRLLRRGAGEEAVLDRLREADARPTADLLPVVRALLKLGVRPRDGFRARRAGPDVCTLCERDVPFCWGCACGFRICQACLEENRWGITCNNVTWECPDCGGMRSF